MTHSYLFIIVSVFWGSLLAVTNHFVKTSVFSNSIREASLLVSLFHGLYVLSGLWNCQWIRIISQGYLFYEDILELYIWKILKGNIGQCDGKTNNHIIYIIHHIASIRLLDWLVESGSIGIISCQIFQVIEFSVLPMTLIRYIHTRKDWKKLRENIWISRLFWWRLVSTLIIRLGYINYLLWVIWPKTSWNTIIILVGLQSMVIQWVWKMFEGFVIKKRNHERC